MQIEMETHMSTINLEHANVTVTDPDASAALLCRLFDWKVRWEGTAMDAGRTVHVGSEDTYIALYSQPDVTSANVNSYATQGQMNHLGVVVENLNDIKQRVTGEGLIITSEADYEPGRRFYFDTPDGLEIEVVSYSS
jgi:catechol 2,3-dioxygenase-like lactoylglutathione lyase family enzyme